MDGRGKGMNALGFDFRLIVPFHSLRGKVLERERGRQRRADGGEIGPQGVRLCVQLVLIRVRAGFAGGDVPCFGPG